MRIRHLKFINSATTLNQYYIRIIGIIVKYLVNKFLNIYTKYGQKLLGSCEPQIGSLDPPLYVNMTDGCYIYLNLEFFKGAEGKGRKKRDGLSGF